MPHSLQALNAVDAVLLGLLALSVLVGVARGLMFEVMTLAGWLVAYTVAYFYSPNLLPWLTVQAPSAASRLDSAFSPAVMPLLAFALCFFGVLIAWGLVAQLLRALLRATPLSGIDRLFGAAFGLLRGGLALLALAALIALTPLAQSSPWRASATRPWLEAGLLAVSPFLPPGLAGWLAR